MMVASRSDMGTKLVQGICGQVDGSVIPGWIGLEAGQSAFGDTYAWFRDLLTWPLQTILQKSSLVTPDIAEKLGAEIHANAIPELSRAAAMLPVNADDPLGIDWLNGRRTPDANQELKAVMTGLTLGTDAPALFKAWVEATCFGAKAIVERFNQEDVPVKGLIGLGGVARKSPYIMQVMSDVMQMPIQIHRSEQTCALGAAMFAATAAGIHANVQEAMHAMGQGFDITYKPNKALASVYQQRYGRYATLGKLFEKDPAHAGIAANV
jgi:L-ribulokinase